MLDESGKILSTHVVTGERKQLGAATQFLLVSREQFRAAASGADTATVGTWTTLQRATGKSGVPFQPIRKAFDSVVA